MYGWQSINIKQILNEYLVGYSVMYSVCAQKRAWRKRRKKSFYFGYNVYERVMLDLELTYLIVGNICENTEGFLYIGLLFSRHKAVVLQDAELYVSTLSLRL